MADLSPASPPEELVLPVPDTPTGEVGALWHAGDGSRGAAVLLAHGAGRGLDADVLVAAREGLAARGHALLAFRYPYMERARREGRRLPPDRRPTLERAHRAALDELRRRAPRARLVLVGKSMGGRIGSLLAAEDADCAALAFLGYPLHPARRPTALRSEHFAAVAQPALFVQGDRDALAELPLLERALPSWGGPVELSVVEGADHDFTVRGRERAEVLADLVGRVASWIGRAVPDSGD